MSERNSEEFLSTSDEDDGQRKSKKRAMKKVLSKSQKKNEEKYYGPIITIAEGRSRRTLTKVDYNFHAYDEQLQAVFFLLISKKFFLTLNF